ncbi:MAG: hypothetical protein WAN75_26440 [Xanthobacteraceae bacterium]|jgi:hypothetical protein
MSSKRKSAAQRAWYDKLLDWGHADTVDFAWGEALELLMQFQNPDALLALLANGAPVPDWARKEIAEWRAGKRPPLPSDLSLTDKELLALVAAVRDPAQKRKGESRDDRINRIAQKRAKAVRAFINNRGGTYDRIVKHWDEWERVYLNPGLGLTPDKS